MSRPTVIAGLGFHCVDAWLILLRFFIGWSPLHSECARDSVNARSRETSRLIPSKAAVQFVELNVRAEARTLQIQRFVQPVKPCPFKTLAPMRCFRSY